MKPYLPKNVAVIETFAIYSSISFWLISSAWHHTSKLLLAPLNTKAELRSFPGPQEGDCLGLTLVMPTTCQSNTGQPAP